MGSEARNHHFVPQSYLRGFTSKGCKDSSFTVFDIQQNKRFETRPRNVCATRDFNRIAVEGLDPNLIEKSMGEFESLINSAIAQIDRSNSFSGEPKEIILNLMSILATRHPGRRENMR